MVLPRSHKFYRLAATAFVVGLGCLVVLTTDGLAQKALVSDDDRDRVLKMLSPDLPTAGNANGAGGGVQISGVTHKGALLKNLPDKFNTESIKNAIVDRKEVPLYAHNPRIGAVGAPVTIVEFSEVGCQSCPDVSEKIKEVFEEYPKHIRWVHKHASVNPFGSNSTAAFYSKVANEHDLFWPYREAVSKLDKPTEEGLVGALVEAGMPVRNTQKLVRLYARDVYRGLDADSALNIKLGLKSPPAVLVNGVAMGGAIPLDMLEDFVVYEFERQGVSYKDEEGKKKGDKAQKNDSL